MIYIKSIVVVSLVFIMRFVNQKLKNKTEFIGHLIGQFMEILSVSRLLVRTKTLVLHFIVNDIKI